MTSLSSVHSINVALYLYLWTAFVCISECRKRRFDLMQATDSVGLQRYIKLNLCSRNEIVPYI